MIYRLFVEKREGYNIPAQKLKADFRDVLSIDVESVRELIRYDVQNMSAEDFEKAKSVVFSEPPCDLIYEERFVPSEGESVFAVEYLPGQYDQRADSAAQCVQLLTRKARPLIRCAKVYAIKGADSEQVERIKHYLINPVESREATLTKPESLESDACANYEAPVIEGFCAFSDPEVERYHAEHGFAMSAEDLKWVRDYFRREGRDPFETELKVIDTYWSDHCRHTTFLTELTDVRFSTPNKRIEEAYALYRELYEEFNAKRADKYPCLMDVATIGAKKLKKEGCLSDLDESDEINACSINVKAKVDGKERDFVVMFKNETHNHPTEIEPYGGAATCLGGAIRDPLSGRTYVYQSMRVTGAADPTVGISETLPGKLPQRVITKTATGGFSSYGNQIGLATGMVHEVYHPNFVAKRLETGFVVGAAPKENIYREKPVPGDCIILLGGDTGRDGCGGATGSSKAHNAHSVAECGAEVQKGNPLTERKIQRLFTEKKVTTLIKKCNDFGAGGVCVAIGELSDSLDISLDKVPKKYEGLTGTELAISESQERMAVVVAKENVERFIGYCREENLNAVAVAEVTDTGRMRMYYGGKKIVDLSREFLNTNGVKQQSTAEIDDPISYYADKVNPETASLLEKGDVKGAQLAELKRLNVTSEKGMVEYFDSTIGARSVYLPYGGRTQLTPNIAMAAKIPADGEIDLATVSAFGYNPYLMEESCFTGAVYSVVLSLAKLVASGVNPKGVRLTFQEYFKRLYQDPRRWGKPLSALLGALYAQLKFKTAAIGGKDSMSGSFEQIDVPSTLISFALGTAEAGQLITNVLQKPGRLYAVTLKRDEYQVPDLDYCNKAFQIIYENIKNKKIKFATVCEEGGIFAAVVKSCAGNRLGFHFALSAEEALKANIGAIVVQTEDPALLKDLEFFEVGSAVSEEVLTVRTLKLTLDEALGAYTEKLEKVYPSRMFAGSDEVPTLTCQSERVLRNRTGSSFAKPRVLIPVFPGTNCEKDTARRFLYAGAEVEEYLIRNMTPGDIDDAVRDISEAIDRCQMIAFPGGFSGGDEPDGSGKFIATTFQNERIRESIHRLLQQRDGLILGICNGFQALIKLGLVPFGEVRVLGEDSPTLTFNRIARHVSTVCEIRVASDKSPWFNAVKAGEVYSVPVSHGEGRFVCPEPLLHQLAENGQIATQYVGFDGRATMESPYNPNGSALAVEGITSPDGRVLGKMGHAERIGDQLYRNYEGRFDMQIFESGVKYFK